MWNKFTYTFEGIENLPNPLWAPYFAKSTVGNDYTLLVCGDKLMMSDTEYEACTNQPLYDLVQAKVDAGITAPNILLIGWGIGFVIDPIKQIAPNADITVIEKYQEVLDLTPPPNDINIMVCDVADAQWEADPEYDIIWSDITEVAEVTQPSDVEFLRDLLSENGTFQYWRAKCNCSV